VRGVHVCFFKRNVSCYCHNITHNLWNTNSQRHSVKCIAIQIQIFVALACVAIEAIPVVIMLVGSRLPSPCQSRSRPTTTAETRDS
jgi:hypothetical protein